MKRIKHPSDPSLDACARVARIILRRRGVALDPKLHTEITLALMLGYRFDERGQVIARGEKARAA